MHQQPALHGLALARPNGFLGIAWTKKQRHARALEKRELWKNRYFECRQKQLLKGNTVVPDDPSGKCKYKWKRWQKWRGKAGERAMAVLESAEKRGVLDPRAAATLQQDLAAAANETPLDPMPLAPNASGELDYADDNLSLGTPPWLVLGAVAAVVTIAGVVIIRR